MARPALHLRLGSPRVPILDRRTIGNSKVGRATCRQMEATTLHLASLPNRPKNVIVRSDPVDGEDCDSGVCVSGCEQQRTNAVSACSGRQRVLERRAFGFEFLQELFAKVLATRRRIVLPVAIPLTPPSGLESAVNLAHNMAFLMFAGILPCARMLQADISNSVVSVSSNKIFRCSHVHPPGPGEDRRGTPQTCKELAAVQRDWLVARVRAQESTLEQQIVTLAVVCFGIHATFPEFLE